MAKDVEFCGDSLQRIQQFPASAKSIAGHELNEVQEGREPSDYRPMPQIGRGVYEIRIRVEEGIFRTIYIAKFEEAVYVLHAFQKKTQQTPKRDIDLAKARLKQLIQNRMS